MKTVHQIVMCLALLGLIILEPCFSKEISTIKPVYTFSDGLISVNSTDSAYNILLKICEDAGVNLKVEGALSGKGKFVFNNLSLEQAIKHLVGGKSLLMIFELSENKSAKKLKEIRIYGSNSKQFSEQSNAIVIEQQIEWIDSLAQQPEAIALEELEELLLDQKNDVVITEYVIDVLGDMNANKVSNILAKGLADNRVNVRNKIVSALGMQDDLNSALVLAQVCYGDANKATRLKAIEQLALSDSFVKKAFLQALLKDHDIDIQSEAEFFLGIHIELSLSSKE